MKEFSPFVTPSAVLYHEITAQNSSAETETVNQSIRGCISAISVGCACALKRWRISSVRYIDHKPNIPALHFKFRSFFKADAGHLHLLNFYLPTRLCHMLIIWLKSMHLTEGIPYPPKGVCNCQEVTA